MIKIEVQANTYQECLVKLGATEKWKVLPRPDISVTFDRVDYGRNANGSGKVSRKDGIDLKFDSIDELLNIMRGLYVDVMDGRNG